MFKDKNCFEYDPIEFIGSEAAVQLYFDYRENYLTRCSNIEFEEGVNEKKYIDYLEKKHPQKLGKYSYDDVLKFIGVDHYYVAAGRRFDSYEMYISNNEIYVVAGQRRSQMSLEGIESITYVCENNNNQIGEWKLVIPKEKSKDKEFLHTFNIYYKNKLCISFDFLFDNKEKKIVIAEPGYDTWDEPKFYILERIENSKYTKREGCYIATCVYGSYDCPEVWTLRRFRDNTLYKTSFGRNFIKIYYTISPLLVKCFGNCRLIKKCWKMILDCIVSKLNSSGYSDTKYNDR